MCVQGCNGDRAPVWLVSVDRLRAYLPSYYFAAIASSLYARPSSFLFFSSLGRLSVPPLSTARPLHLLHLGHRPASITLPFLPFLSYFLSFFGTRPGPDSNGICSCPTETKRQLIPPSRRQSPFQQTPPSRLMSIPFSFISIPSSQITVHRLLPLR